MVISTKSLRFSAKVPREIISPRRIRKQEEGNVNAIYKRKRVRSEAKKKYDGAN